MLKKVLAFIAFGLFALLSYSQTRQNVYLFDVSGSMIGLGDGASSNVFNAAKQQFSQSVAAMDKACRVSIITYSSAIIDSISGQVPKDKDVLCRFIDNMAISKGNTNLNSVWKSALRNLPDNGDTKLIVITDGRHNIGTDDNLANTLEEFPAKYRNANAYFLVLDSTAYSTNVAQIFAKHSGHQMYLIHSLGEIWNLPQGTKVSPTATGSSSASQPVSETRSNFPWWILLLVLLLIGLVFLFHKQLVTMLNKVWQAIQKAIAQLGFGKYNKMASSEEEEVKGDDNPYENLRVGPFRPLVDAPRTKKKTNPDGSTKYWVPGTNTGHTDLHNGKIIANPGGKGSDQAPNFALDNPKANKTYITEDGKRWKTDSKKRTTFAEMDIDENSMNDTYPPLNKERREALGIANDKDKDAGHLLPHALNGNNEAINLVAQKSKEQRQGSRWANNENDERNKIKEYLKQNPKEKIKLQRKIEYYPGTRLPRTIRTKVFNPCTGEVLCQGKFDFSL